MAGLVLLLFFTVTLISGESCDGGQLSEASQSYPNIAEIVSLYGPEPFPFTMWLITHRTQFMILDKLIYIAKLGKQNLPNTKIASHFSNLFDLVWGPFMTTHQSEEDEIFFPWIRKNGGPAAEDILLSLQLEHLAYLSDEESLLQSVSQLSRLGGEEDQLILTDLITWLENLSARYISHALHEEKKLVPLIASISKEEQSRLADVMKKRGKESPKSSFSLLLFRDTCTQNPEDAAIWDRTLPWFVRNVVINALSLINSDYVSYKRLTALSN